LQPILLTTYKPTYKNKLPHKENKPMTRKASKFFPEETSGETVAPLATSTCEANEPEATIRSFASSQTTVPTTNCSSAVYPNNEYQLPEISVKAYPINESQQHPPNFKDKSISIALLGDCKLRPNKISRRNRYITLLGDHKIDLRQAQFPSSGNISIAIFKLAGDVKLIVPESVSVSVKAFMLCSDKRIEETAEASTSSSPHVKLVIINLCGNVVVSTID
jgi:hypothetical protein